MRLIKKIEGLTDFKIIEKELLYLTKNKIENKETLVFRDGLITENEFSFYSIYLGDIYYKTMSGDIYKIKKKSLKNVVRFRSTSMKEQFYLRTILESTIILIMRLIVN